MEHEDVCWFTVFLQIIVIYLDKGITRRVALMDFTHMQ